MKGGSMGEISTAQKRLGGDKFEVYLKLLREHAKRLKKRIGFGRFITIPVTSGHGRKHYSPVGMKTKDPYSKMHSGESFKDFRDRRKVSNKKRRAREKET
jgi:hypothetical protein